MRYLCVHCDKTFEHEEEAKPRCPSCMRKNGIEEAPKPKAASEGSSARRAWPLFAGAGVLVALGIGYAVWAGSSADTVEGEAGLEPLAPTALAGYLRRANVDARQLAQLLEADERVEAFAREAVGSRTGTAAGEAIHEAIRARAAARAFSRWSMGVPRERAIVGAATVAEWLAEDEGRHRLYPLEIAAFAVSALRARDVPAMVAQVYSYPGDRSPPDPTGQVGYYVLAVYPGDAGEGDPTYYDVYKGRELQPEEARVLTDVQVIAAALHHRALHLLSRENDPERALELSGQALRLDPRSPEARAVQGAVLLVAGRPDEGVRELEAARQLREDAPRRNLLAGVYMAQGDLEAASREISAALSESPEFAPGHATLAAIQLGRGENDLARGELEEAARLDPDLHILPRLWAGYYAATGDMDRAVSHARASVEANPNDIQARLMAARIYRQAARYDMMRREAHAIVEMTQRSRQSEMRELIQQMLGPTALEPIDEPEDDDEALWDDDEELVAEDVDLGGGSLQLDAPTGVGGRRGGSPSLLGGQQLGGGLGGGAGAGAGGAGGGFQLQLGD